MPERRSGQDRRRNPGRVPLFSRPRRRRSPGRRASDRAGYVDLYDARIWFGAASILALSLLDGVLTGLQLRTGNLGEANPVMRIIIHHGGVYLFLSVKAALTAIALAVIILHMKWALARRAARLCLWSYILVASYHIYLILHLNGVRP